MARSASSAHPALERLSSWRCRGGKQPKWVLRPPDFKTKVIGFEAEGGEVVTQRVMCPYWWCVDRADLLGADTPATLAKMSGTIEAPVGHWNTYLK